MKQKTLYTCEYCNTDYADKEKALECESKILRIICRFDYV